MIWKMSLTIQNFQEEVLSLLKVKLQASSNPRLSIHDHLVMLFNSIQIPSQTFMSSINVVQVTKLQVRQSTLGFFTPLISNFEEINHKIA